MVVLYMARDNNKNIPAGPGDESARFYNRGFRAICPMRARIARHTIQTCFQTPNAHPPSHTPLIPLGPATTL